ncbi:MAG: MBL fold metallo-hydrolase, partial [Synechococcales cyanobacterium RU_4_20]|nr:MBL fold metallo-hydrolase [Synechococcales cyanobacterium RU_4_20]
RTAKTFHWERQLRSVAALRDRFSPETLQYLCPGASIGFLRGQYCVADAYEKLRSLNLAALHKAKPSL